jgi:hypothetical protein
MLDFVNVEQEEAGLIFAPGRQDWIDGTATYLSQK